MKAFQVFFVVLILTGMFVFSVVDVQAGGSPSFGITAGWTKIGDTNGDTIQGNGNHNIVVDGNNVYAAYDNAAGAVYKAGSENGGLSWEGSVFVANGRIAGLAMNPVDKTVHFLYSDSGTIYYVGQGEPIRVSGSVVGNQYTNGIAADGNGGVHVVFSSATDYSLYYTMSNDNGATFPLEPTQIAGPGTAPYGASITSDNSGNVFVTYIGQDYGIYFMKKLAGQSWATPVKVGDGSSQYFSSSIAAYDANRIYIGWKGSQAVLVASTSNGGQTWTTNVVFGGDVWYSVSLVVDSNLNLNIVWDGPGGTKFSRTINANPAKWITPVLAAPLFLPNIAVDASGKAYIMGIRIYHSRAVSFTKEK